MNMDNNTVITKKAILESLVECLSASNFPVLTDKEKLQHFSRYLEANKAKLLNSDFVLIQALCAELAKKKPRITFNMLAALTKLDNPVFKKFEDLSYSAICRKTGKRFLFNAENTPDLDVNMAFDASQAYIKTFTAITLSGKYLQPGYPETAKQTLHFVTEKYANHRIPGAFERFLQNIPLLHAIFYGAEELTHPSIPTDTIFALSYFDPEDITNLKTLVGQQFKKIQNIVSNKIDYKTLSFTKEEIVAITKALDEKANNISQGLKQKFITEKNLKKPEPREKIEKPEQNPVPALKPKHNPNIIPNKIHELCDALCLCLKAKNCTIQNKIPIHSALVKLKNSEDSAEIQQVKIRMIMLKIYTDIQQQADAGKITIKDEKALKSFLELKSLLENELQDLLIERKHSGRIAMFNTTYFDDLAKIYGLAPYYDDTKKYNYNKGLGSINRLYYDKTKEYNKEIEKELEPILSRLSYEISDYTKDNTLQDAEKINRIQNCMKKALEDLEALKQKLLSKQKQLQVKKILISIKKELAHINAYAFKAIQQKTVYPLLIKNLSFYNEINPTLTGAKPKKQKKSSFGKPDATAYIALIK